MVVPPPLLGPDDVRKTRKELGVSQPVFADFLGTSPSTVRSWEQGQKVPSPMARRLLGLMEPIPPIGKRFASMVQPQGNQNAFSVAAQTARRPSGTRRRGDAARRRGGNR